MGSRPWSIPPITFLFTIEWWKVLWRLRSFQMSVCLMWCVWMLEQRVDGSTSRSRMNCWSSEGWDKRIENVFIRWNISAFFFCLGRHICWIEHLSHHNTIMSFVNNNNNNNAINLKRIPVIVLMTDTTSLSHNSNFESAHTRCRSVWTSILKRTSSSINCVVWLYKRNIKDHE